MNSDGMSFTRCSGIICYLYVAGLGQDQFSLCGVGCCCDTAFALWWLPRCDWTTLFLFCLHPLDALYCVALLCYCGLLALASCRRFTSQALLLLVWRLRRWFAVTVW